jgi:exonuclease III
MLKDLIHPSKGTAWQNGLKRKTQQFVAYRRPISPTEISIGLGWKGWKKIYQTNGPRKQAGVAILISDKVDFKPTLIKQDEEGHSILVRGEIDQKEIIIINLYAPNVNAPNFIKHTLKDLKAYINSNTVVVGDFNTPLSSIGRSSKQKNQ